MTLLDLTPRSAARDATVALPVAIVGAGPIGLAAAAHLLERGIDFVVLEAGDAAGATVREWGHVRLFSPWRHLTDPAARALLERGGWDEPPADEAPTGAELVARYLEPLAQLPAIAHRMRTGVEVIAVSREGMDRTRTRGRAGTPFTVRVRAADGTVEDLSARAVIDASGTFRTPNPLASNGLDLPGLDGLAAAVASPLPDVLGRDRARFAGRHSTVVGAGHSAANTLLSLVDLAREEPGTRITWLLRTARAVRVTASDDDELRDRARLGARLEDAVAAGAIEVVDGFQITGARPAVDGIVLAGTRDGHEATHATDVVVAATGFRPDLSMLREIRLDLDEIVEAPRRLAPLIDPNEHSCGTVEPHGYRELRHPEDGFFIVGMKSYGRAPTFLLATGYEQVRSVTAWLAGDAVSAQAVELVLPGTGVCSTDSGEGCCA